LQREKKKETDSMRNSTAIGVGVGVATCLSAGMFALSGYMAVRFRTWADQEAELSGAQQCAVQASMFFTHYWYAIVPAVFVVCLAVAAACSIGRRRPG
jgi:NADH:ubiquinone oxidoreductase subunit 6 (subunit J)